MDFLFNFFFEVNKLKPILLPYVTLATVSYEHEQNMDKANTVLRMRGLTVNMGAGQRTCSNIQDEGARGEHGVGSKNMLQYTG